MKRLIVALMVLLIFVSFTSAQEDTSELVLIDQVKLTEIILDMQVNIEETLTISPDGEKLAWFNSYPDSQVCVTLLQAPYTPTCFLYNNGRGFVEGLAWSPDSKFLTFSGIQELLLLDIEAEEMHILTDPSAENGSGGGGQTRDYLPQWHPITGEIYFWRSVRSGDVIGHFLYRISKESGEPQLIQDFSSLFTQYWDKSLMDFFSGGSRFTFSPDGQQIAILATSSEDDPNNGLWVFDLENNALEHIVSYSSITTAYPLYALEIDTVIPTGVTWMPDSSGLVLITKNMLSSVIYYLDAETWEMTPLYDLSDFSSGNEFASTLTTIENIEVPASFLMSGSYVLMPDGSLLTLNGDWRIPSVGMLHWSLPPNDSLSPNLIIPPPDHSVGENGLDASHRISVSSDGSKVVMGRYLLTFAENADTEMD